MKWGSDLKSLCWFMNTYASSAYEEQPSDDIRGVEAVQVMTIHQAKGLEWPVVFIFSLVRNRFPPRMMGRERNWWDVPRDMFDVERYEGGLEDERRLFYVAITRPRDVLVLSCFEKISNSVGECIFVEDLGDGLITELGGGDFPEVSVKQGVVPEELQSFSAKELVGFNFCPHRYLLRDLWGYQPGLQPRLGYGNSLHHCLRVAGELVKSEGYSPVSAVSTAVDEEFNMPFMGGSVLEDFKETAKRTLVEFSKKYGTELSRIEEVEYRLEYSVMNATVMGKVDVLLRDGGDVEVWDYKTSDEAESFNETSLQLRLYTLGLKNLNKTVSRGAVAYLEQPEVKAVPMDTSLLDEAKAYAEGTVAKITGRDFAPCPGENCKKCDHGSVCRWKAS
jgi:DNA helicase-2/ATP-dependent DNA helicase PcrA